MSDLPEEAMEQLAVNEVIRQLFSSCGSPELLYIAALCKRTGRDENGNYCTYVDEELRRRLETKLIICSILLSDFPSDKRGFDLN